MRETAKSRREVRDCLHAAHLLRLSPFSPPQTMQQQREHPKQWVCFPLLCQKAPTRAHPHVPRKGDSAKVALGASKLEPWNERRHSGTVKVKPPPHLSVSGNPVCNLLTGQAMLVAPPTLLPPCGGLLCAPAATRTGTQVAAHGLCVCVSLPPPSPSPRPRAWRAHPRTSTAAESAALIGGWARARRGRPPPRAAWRQQFNNHVSASAVAGGASCLAPTTSTDMCQHPTGGWGRVRRGRPDICIKGQRAKQQLTRMLCSARLLTGHTGRVELSQPWPPPRAAWHQHFN